MVCLLLTFVSLTEMTRSTDMPVGGLTWVGPGTMYYMGIQIPMGKGQLLGLSGPLRSILSH